MAHVFDGVKLTQCFNVVSNAGKEIDALSEILNNQLAKAIAKTSFRLDQKEPIYSERNDDSDWISTGIANSFALKSKGKKVADNYLSYQVSLYGDGVGSDENAEPLLHVYLWSVAADYDEDCYMYIPYPASSEEDPWELTYNGQLISWDNFEGWTFSIRLTTLNSAQDLEQYVVNPAIALLNGEQPEEAFAGSHPGLITYQITEDGMLVIKED